MKSTCIINSNRGRYKYKLTPTGFTSLRLRGICVTYSIDRTNIRAALSGSVSIVYVYYHETDTGRHFDVKLTPSGCLWIGCKHFNKTTTRLLRKWFTC